MPRPRSVVPPPAHSATADQRAPGPVVLVPTTAADQRVPGLVVLVPTTAAGQRVPGLVVLVPTTAAGQRVPGPQRPVRRPRRARFRSLAVRQRGWSATVRQEGRSAPWRRGRECPAPSRARGAARAGRSGRPQSPPWSAATGL
ncbi:hypothetical protein V2J52_15010 [Georgenia sp. MJ173]|uniref:hypothetical protein n=1 Tax=Georgenia sunbinii TaxID=3117728 RepID=UPI002F260AC5